jgi:hypothetical protein
MTVRDDELHWCTGARVLGRPRPNEAIYGADYIDVPSSRVEQQRALVAEDQIEKRLLEVRARCLTQDEEVRIVGVRADLRRIAAVRASRVETVRQPAGFEVAGLVGRSRPTRARKRGTYHSDENERS